MKYYVYISETKVNMLFDQIPTRLRDTLATELKIDLKVFSTTFTEGTKQQTLISQLNVVTEYVDKHEQVGSVESPQSYFRGTLDMEWAYLRFGLDDPHTVVFASRTDENTLVLTGSGENLIGANKNTTAITYPHLTSSAFAMQQLLEYLAKVKFKEADPQKVFNGRKYDLNYLYDFLNHKGVNQKLEFLAKRFVVNKHPDDSEIEDYLFGSPIYVALAD